MKRFLESKGVKMRYKQDIWWCHVIGWVAWIIGYRRFMDRTTTFGNMVALGRDKRLGPYVAVHELCHVYQLRRHGSLRFYWRYLFDQKWRALYEIKAHIVGTVASNTMYVTQSLVAETQRSMRDWYGIDKIHMLFVRACVEQMIEGQKYLDDPAYRAYRQWEADNDKTLG
jgi:hypothetical protein